jgi:hypothetical protein
MTQEKIDSLIENARIKIKEHGPSFKSLAKIANVKYNTVKGFLDNGTIPQLDTFIRIVLAAGFSLADLEVTDGRLVQISDDEELSYLRMYKRLDGDYQDYVKKSIAYCTAKQEKELEAIPESESVKVSRQRNKKK